MCYYLYMRHLQDIIRESILDDENTLMQTAENNAYKHLLGPHSTSWDVENKMLIHNDDMQGNKLILYPSKENSGKRPCDWIYSQLKEVQDAGLKFEPLSTCIIDDMYEQHPNTWLSTLSCDKIGALSMIIYNKDIDFTKFKGEIKHIIQFLSSYNGVANNITVTPPKYHVGVVHFKSTHAGPVKYKKIVGWDCDYLIVDGENYREKRYLVDTDETICGYYKDQLQDLIDNNPKAKEIFIYDSGGWYWRCSCKGIGKSRKLHDLTNRTDKYVVKILTQYENKCKQL